MRARRAVTAAALAVTAAGFGARAAAAPGERPVPPGAAVELVVDTTYPRELCDAAREAFQEAMKGAASVRFRRSRDPRAILERLRGEARQGVHHAGIWWGGSAVRFAEAAAEGLLATYAPRWSQGLLPHGSGEEGTWQSCHLLAFAPVFARAPGAALPEAPDPRDFLGAAWKDRVVLLDPSAAPEGGDAFLVLANALLGGAPLDDGALDRAATDLRRLEFNVRGVARSYEELADLAGDDWVVTIAEVSDFVRAGLDDDPRFARGVFRGGTPVIPDGIAVLAGAPDPGSARTFFDVVTSVGFLTGAAGEHGRIPARRDLAAAAIPPWVVTATERPRPLDAEGWAGAADPLVELWSGKIRGRRERYERGLFLDNVLTVVFTGIIFAVAWFVIRGNRSGPGSGGGSGRGEEDGTTWDAESGEDGDDREDARKELAP